MRSYSSPSLVKKKLFSWSITDIVMDYKEKKEKKRKILKIEEEKRKLAYIVSSSDT